MDSSLFSGEKETSQTGLTGIACRPGPTVELYDKRKMARILTASPYRVNTRKSSQNTPPKPILSGLAKIQTNVCIGPARGSGYNARSSGQGKTGTIIKPKSLD
jgi:hypothetical protein